MTPPQHPTVTEFKPSFLLPFPCPLPGAFGEVDAFGPLRAEYFLANLLPLYHLLKSVRPSNAKPLWEEGKGHHAANDTRIGEISNEEDKWPFLLLRLHSGGAGPSSCAPKGRQPCVPASGWRVLVPFVVTDPASLCLSGVSAPEADCPGGVAQGHPFPSTEPRASVYSPPCIRAL